MSNCEHTGDWLYGRPVFKPTKYISVRCADCGIETNVAIELVKARAVTGNTIRMSWGQPHNFTPSIPDTTEELLALIDGDQS